MQNSKEQVKERNESQRELVLSIRLGSCSLDRFGCIVPMLLSWGWYTLHSI